MILFGDCGYGSCGLNTFVRTFDKENSVFVVRTPSDQLQDCVFSLMCVSEVKKLPVVLRTLQIASCMRTCLKYMKRIYIESIERDIGLTDDERAVEIDRVTAKLDKLEL